MDNPSEHRVIRINIIMEFLTSENVSTPCNIFMLPLASCRGFHFNVLGNRSIIKSTAVKIAVKSREPKVLLKLIAPSVTIEISIIPNK